MINIYFLKKTFLIAFLLLPFVLLAQAPNISYSNVQSTYFVGAAITPLTPTNSGGAQTIGINPGSAYSYLGNSFSSSNGVAVDGAGNVYISDTGTSTIKKMNASGGNIQTLGSGFSFQRGIAIDTAGYIYVADTGNNVVKKMNSSGSNIQVITSVYSPRGIALDGSGNIYVTHSNNQRVHKYTSSGIFISALGPIISFPTGIAMDNFGNIFVTDTDTNTITKMDNSGGNVQTIASGFNIPLDIKVETNGSIYVADMMNYSVIKMNSTGGDKQYIPGFYSPSSVALDSSGNLFVADSNFDKVKKIVKSYYGISRPLPAGLSFNYSTGVISGTPTVATPNTYYTIYTQNFAGSSSTTINFSTEVVPIPDISYSNVQSTYYLGSTISSLTPINSGGAPFTGFSLQVASGLNQPRGVTLDNYGNLYVSDTNNHSIKKMNNLGGNIQNLGSGFSYPYRVALDDTGNIFVADYGNSAVKKMDALGGNIQTLGSGFVSPAGIALDSSGNIYVADFDGNSIKKMNGLGGNIQTLGSGFLLPFDLSLDSSGNIFVSDYGNNLIKKMNNVGGNIQTVGSGFNYPRGLSLDLFGNIYIADTSNHVIKKMDNSGSNIQNVASGFSYPFDATVDPFGNIYVPDTNNNSIKKIVVSEYSIFPTLPAGLIFDATTGTISGTPTVATPSTTYTIYTQNASGSNSTTITFATESIPIPNISYSNVQSTYYLGSAISSLTPTNSGGATSTGVNTGSSIITLGSGFNQPRGVAVDAAGNIFVADSNNNLVKKMDSSGGNIQTLGSGFNNPRGVTVDASGNIFVADLNNNAVKKMNSTGGNIQTLGSGFSNPIGVSLDASGNIYVADTGNNSVKKMNSSGGNIQVLGTGFSGPRAVGIDDSANIYVADTGNSSIKKMNSAGGSIQTLGSGFNTPTGVSLDNMGNIFIANLGNNDIKKMNSVGGNIQTIGSGFSSPYGLTTDNIGSVYIADTNNNSIKKIVATHYSIVPTLPAGLSFDSATGVISGTPTVATPSTTYTIYTQNASGSNSTTITFATLVALSATTVQTDILCNGSSTGSASVNPSGGTGSYTYVWKRTAPTVETLSSTTNTASGLSAGTYTCDITSGSETITKTFTITEPSALAATTSQVDVACNGASTGSASVNVSGGTGAYTYVWTRTAPTTGALSSTTNSVSGLSAGTYVVTVKDANLCELTRTFTITEPTALSATTVQTNILCNGTSTGSATVSVSGGEGGYTYVWTRTAPTTGTLSSTTNSVSGLSAGTYVVTVKDANLCELTRTFTITEPTALVATTSQVDVACNGASTGSAIVSVSGGEGGYTYVWTQTAPTTGTLSSTTNSVSGLSAGTYVVTVKDANLCELTRTFTITEPTALAATTSQVDVACNGALTGSATVNVSGGTGAYTYVWTQTAPTTGTLSSTTNSVSGLSAGTYVVTVKDVNECQITRTFTITEPTALAATTSQTDVLCNGASTGSVTVSVSGGTGAYTYVWTQTAPTTGTLSSTTNTVSGLSAGTYVVTVKDANLCELTRTFTITEPTALSATTSQTDVACNGASTGSATVSVSGSTGAYTYVWTQTAPTTGTLSSTTNSASGLSAGTYVVTVKDANLCELTITFTITESPVMDLTVNQTGNTLTAVESGATYQWLICDGMGGYTEISNEFNQSYQATTSGNYAVRITKNGCTQVSNCVSLTYLGIRDNDAKNINTLYPNPTSGIFYIKSENESKMTIYSMSGQLVKTQILKKGENKVDISVLPAAMYLVKVDKENYKVIKR